MWLIVWTGMCSLWQLLLNIWLIVWSGMWSPQMNRHVFMLPPTLYQLNFVWPGMCSYPNDQACDHSNTHSFKIMTNYLTRHVVNHNDQACVPFNTSSLIYDLMLDKACNRTQKIRHVIISTPTRKKIENLFEQACAQTQMTRHVIILTITT